MYAFMGVCCVYICSVCVHIIRNAGLRAGNGLIIGALEQRGAIWWRVHVCVHVRYFFPKMWGWNLPHHEFKRVNPRLSANQQVQTCLPPLSAPSKPFFPPFSVCRAAGWTFIYSNDFSDMCLYLHDLNCAFNWNIVLCKNLELPLSSSYFARRMSNSCSDLLKDVQKYMEI